MRSGGRENALTRPDATADALLAIVHQLAAELHPAKAGAPPTLDSALERDLGFDSLGRVELMLRLDRSFGVSLPEKTLVVAETPRPAVRSSGNPRKNVPRQLRSSDPASVSICLWVRHLPKPGRMAASRIRLSEIVRDPRAGDASA